MASPNTPTVRQAYVPDVGVRENNHFYQHVSNVKEPRYAQHVVDLEGVVIVGVQGD
jgi:hypothetical protein